MKEIKLKTRIVSLTENSANEKAMNGDEYISVKISSIIDRVDETGSIKKSNFLNFKKVSLLDSLAMLNKDCKKAVKLCDVATAIKVADIVFSGVEITITRAIYEKGEKSPLQEIELERTTIINSINVEDNDNVQSDDDFQEDIKLLLDEGKDIRKRQDEEKAMFKKAAKEALLAKLALAAEPTIEPEPEPEPKDE